MPTKLPSLSEYMARAEGPELIKATSPDGRYVKFKYSDHAIYNCKWDIITLNARGHVFRVSDGECVLRPWSKFFNYSELYGETGQPTGVNKILESIPGLEPDFHFDDPHLATDKLDGSLLIAGIVDDELLATTSGSFTAWQGDWARAWLIENKVQTHMVPGLTYMFEIIADEDLHPIRYEYEGCVLTGIIETATGIEKPYAELQRFAAEAGIRVTQSVELSSFDETLKYVQSLPASKEGLVLTYPNGFKMKLKGPEFLAVQKLFHGLSQKSLMGVFDPELMSFPEETRKTVPEEFKELTDFMDSFERRFRSTYYKALGFCTDCYLRALPEKSRAIYELARETFGDIPAIIGTVCSYARKMPRILAEQKIVESLVVLRRDIADALIKTILNENKNKE